MCELLANIKEKVNSARKDGFVTEAIMECVNTNGGIATRSQILDYVRDVIGLTHEERHSTYFSDNGHPVNYFETVVGYECTDLAQNKYEEFSLTNNKDGIWCNERDVIPAGNIRTIARRTNIVSRRNGDIELRKVCKTELSQAYMNLPKADRPKNVNMDKLIDKMINDSLSAEETLQLM